MRCESTEVTPSGSPIGDHVAPPSAVDIPMVSDAEKETFRMHEVIEHSSCDCPLDDPPVDHPPKSASTIDQDAPPSVLRKMSIPMAADAPNARHVKALQFAGVGVVFSFVWLSGGTDAVDHDRPPL